MRITLDTRVINWKNLDLGFEFYNNYRADKNLLITLDFIFIEIGIIIDL